jgi:hypothetical protein
MGSRFSSHQLSNGLYVSGRPEQPKEKAPTICSTAMPYTGGDIKKSGELGKMFDLHVENSRKSGPLGNAPLRNTSFGGTASNSGPVSNVGGRSNYSGSLSSSVPGAGGSARAKSNSGPLNKHEEPTKRSSGPQSGGVTPMAWQNSGPQPPVLPTTGLITSGPISGPLNSSGAPRKVSGPLDSVASMKMRATSFAHNPAVTNLNTEDGYSIQGSFPKPILWAVILLFVMGFIAGGFILGAVHNAILLIVVVVIFGLVASLLIWNACWGRRGATGFVNRYPDADLRTARDGQYVKVTGVCKSDILFFFQLFSIYCLPYMLVLFHSWQTSLFLNMVKLFMIGIFHVTQSALNHLQSYLSSGSNGPGNKKTYDNFSS